MAAAAGAAYDAGMPGVGRRSGTGMQAPAARRRRWPLVLGVAVLVLFGLAEPAQAWGPTVHVWIADAILKAFALSVPVVAELLRRHPHAFVYGNLAPDFFVGKGSGGHDEHCHNWEVGQRVLELAGTDAERAFALGYLSHLAADVIGHNHFVPNYLYRSFGLRKLGHAYWEMHADNLLAESYAHCAARLIADEEQHRHDALLVKAVGKGPVPLWARKSLFAAYLRLNVHHRTRRLMRRVRPYSEHSLRHDDIWLQMDVSLALSASAVADPRVPRLLAYDPVGAENIRIAKKLRRRSRRARSFSKGDVPFPIPQPLLEHLALLEPVARAVPLPDPPPDGGGAAAGGAPAETAAG
ncbi:MAG: hypothetical protein KatS3mg102_0271 [Planctomycetota bacterium]|nr:MAG: hypothetical protein KatS3mg102_0271 [Planctomycetota bacterium]